jgi:hypothetical protein
MRKKFFFSVAALLGAALFFSACPTDEPDDGNGDSLSSENAITKGSVKIKGISVDWTANPAANDGTTFEKAISGKVAVIASSTGISDLALPDSATVKAVLATAVSTQTVESFDSATGVASATDLDTDTLFNTAEELVLYLKVTPEDNSASLWYKISVSVAATDFPKGSSADSNATVKIVSVDNGIAALKVKQTGESWSEGWYSIPSGDGSDDPATVINAIYNPNKETTTADTIETGKTAFALDATLSAAALNLFEIEINNNGKVVKVNITGDVLPAAPASGSPDADKIVVIDVGSPSEVNTLPTFYIPYQKLGVENGAYGHIRLRVNNGAELVILADNSNYISNESGTNNCEDGYFNGGCVEVMAGGKLRDGAFEGFPLGAQAVILNRYNSYLSVGPEPGTDDAKANSGTAYTNYYAGYLLAPASETNTRIKWEAADSVTTGGSYLEVRPAQIATNAKLTVKKSLGLIYSVWFVDNAQVILDVPTSSNEAGFPASFHGLASNEKGNGGADFNFYATASKPVIVIKLGNSLDGRYLASGSKTDTEAANLMISNAIASDVTITSPASGTSVEYGTGTGISGWLVTPPVTNQGD